MVLQIRLFATMGGFLSPEDHLDQIKKILAVVGTPTEERGSSWEMCPDVLFGPSYGSRFRRKRWTGSGFETGLLSAVPHRFVTGKSECASVNSGGINLLGVLDTCKSWLSLGNI